MTGYRRWADLSWPEFGALDPQRTVAVLPVAAIEQHGPHLPLSTDARINQGVLQAALDRVPAAMCLLILPELPVGKSDEHAAYPGTLTLGTETLMRVWFEIAQSVHRAGVRKLLILNSHGGQGSVARIVVQDHGLGTLRPQPFERIFCEKNDLGQQTPACPMRLLAGLSGLACFKRLCAVEYLDAQQ